MSGGASGPDASTFTRSPENPPTTPPTRTLVGAADPRQELADDATLADARAADDGEQLRPLIVARPFERVDKQAQLPRRPTRRARIARQPARLVGCLAAGASGPARRDAFRAAADSDRADRLVLDGFTRQLRGDGPDEDLAGVRLLLQPGGDVDDVARDEDLLPLVDGRDDLARVDADPRFEGERRLLVQRGRSRPGSRAPLGRRVRRRRRGRGVRRRRPSPRRR